VQKRRESAHHTLPKLSLDHLPEPAPIRPAVVVNDQTLERFVRESDSIAAAAPALTWLRPSDHDRDRAEALDPVARIMDDSFEHVLPVGAGRLRGVLLHKLMEELLTGELTDTDPAAAERRAAQLLEELLGREETQPDAKPDPTEMARTALNTLTLADVVALRPLLLPEIAIWSSSSDGSCLAGRADALAVEDGNVIAVLDWKSDIAPSQNERAGYASQLSEYLAATGAPRGALVYMNPGEIVWVDASARP
jgi:hypothetical protein